MSGLGRGLGEFSGLNDLSGLGSGLGDFLGLKGLSGLGRGIGEFSGHNDLSGLGSGLGDFFALNGLSGLGSELEVVDLAGLDDLGGVTTTIGDVVFGESEDVVIQDEEEDDIFLVGVLSSAGSCGVV